jgi:hypothetical protein
MSLLSLMMTVLLQSTGLSSAADAIEQHFAEPVAAPARVASPAKPVPEPRDRQCGKPPVLGTCAGAIGFCPEYRCTDGEWVDTRRLKRHRKGDPMALRAVDPRFATPSASPCSA